MKISDKLEHFATDIMADVNQKRQDILEEMKKEYEAAYSKKETEYLTDAYDIIQNGLKKISKEKNEIISKTMMNNKVRLLDKRNQVIQNVFDMTKQKLIDFTKSEEYETYLIENLKETFDKIGEGEIQITLNYSDAHLKELLIQTFKCDVLIASEKVDFIAGYQLLNKTKHIFIDDTFATRLEHSREDFVKSCKIDVEI